MAKLKTSRAQEIVKLSFYSFVVAQHILILKQTGTSDTVFYTATGYVSHTMERSFKRRFGFSYGNDGVVHNSRVNIK